MHGLYLGSSVCLVTDESLWAETLKPWGVTLPQFRRLLRKLRIPVIELPNRRFLVSLNAFQLAMTAITRIGQPNFLMPGSVSIDKPDRSIANSIQTLDPTYFKDNYETIIGEYIAFAEANGQSVTKEFRERLSEAGSQVALALMSAACSRYQKQSDSYFQRAYRKLRGYNKADASQPTTADASEREPRPDSEANSGSRDLDELL